MADIKYENEIKQLISDISYNGDDDIMRKIYPIEKAVQDFLGIVGKTMEELSNDIQIGVNNGYSVEQQLLLFKKILC